MIDYVSMAKAFLNRLLLLPYLRYSSLTAIPHAMKRKAAEVIGFHNLSIPPKAYAIGAMRGLVIDHVSSVNVFNTNKVRAAHIQGTNEIENMILGDHIEAIQWIQSKIGPRAYFNDKARWREFLEIIEKVNTN